MHKYMPGLYNYVLHASEIIAYRLLEVLGCETPHGAYDNKKRWKKTVDNKKGSTPGIEPSTSDSLGVHATF